MSAIFGGSKSQGQSTSESGNKAFDTISSAFGPTFGYAKTGGDALMRLLSGDASGFNAYKGATGFDAAAEAGSRGITNNAAAGGLLRSGSTAKGLASFYNNLQNQYAGSYMDRMLGLAGLGMQGGALVSDAGKYGTSQQTQNSSTKPGLGGFLGAIGSGIAASDRRLKEKVFKIGKLKNGLNLYQYHYTNGSGPHVGVMADEVEKTIPEAMGPVVNGFKTVDYGKLELIGA